MTISNPQGKTSELVESADTVGGLVKIHRRLMDEVSEHQRTKGEAPWPIWSERQAWADATAIMLACVEMESRASELTRLEEENGKLRDDLHDAQRQPWPAWAVAIREKLRSFGVETDDATDDSCDLAEVFGEWVDDYEQECNRKAERLQSLNVEAVGVLERAHKSLRALQEGAAIAIQTLGPDAEGPVADFLCAIHREAVRGLIASDDVVNEGDARSLLSRLQSGSENKDLAGEPGDLASASGVFSPESEAGDSAPHHTTALDANRADWEAEFTAISVGSDTVRR